MIECLLRKASPVLRMAEQSDAFKQLDAVGKSRYNKKLGMLGITTDLYMTPKDVLGTTTPLVGLTCRFPTFVCISFIQGIIIANGME